MGQQNSETFLGCLVKWWKWLDVPDSTCSESLAIKARFEFVQRDVLCITLFLVPILSLVSATPPHIAYHLSPAANHILTKNSGRHALLPSNTLSLVSIHIDLHRWSADRRQRVQGCLGVQFVEKSVFRSISMSRRSSWKQSRSCCSKWRNWLIPGVLREENSVMMWVGFIATSQIHGFQAVEDSKKEVAISAQQGAIDKKVSPYLFEGDIFLSRRQAVDILKALSKDKTKRLRRSFVSDKSATWKQMPIRYRFHESIGNAEAFDSL